MSAATLEKSEWPQKGHKNTTNETRSRGAPRAQRKEVRSLPSKVKDTSPGASAALDHVNA
jgi:hypothetical protein